jgi:hypothetical protein
MAEFVIGKTLGLANPKAKLEVHDVDEQNRIIKNIKKATANISTKIGTPKWHNVRIAQDKKHKLEMVFAPITEGKRRTRILCCPTDSRGRLKSSAHVFAVDIQQRKDLSLSVRFLTDDGVRFVGFRVSKDRKQVSEVAPNNTLFFNAKIGKNECVDRCLERRISGWLVAVCTAAGGTSTLAACLAIMLAACRDECGWTSGS